jgi:hypothetical protein
MARKLNKKRRMKRTLARTSNEPPPWKRKRPASPSTPLTPKERHEARTRARAAGRPYPNLVDNMAVARKRKRSRPRRTAAARKRHSNDE